MPIDSRFESSDSGFVYSLVKIEPGERFGFLDTITGVGQFVVAVCNKFDQGAAVFLVDQEPGVKHGDKVSAELSEENLVALIQPGFRYERDIIDWEGDRGTLVFQHVMPQGDGLIQSLN